MIDETNYMGDILIAAAEDRLLRIVTIVIRFYDALCREIIIPKVE